MLHNDIQSQLQLLIKVSTPPLIDVARHPAESPVWTVGQRLPAHVQAALPNGRFQVQIEDQILDMNLPRNTMPGEKLELTYAGSSPRLTFILGGQQSTALGQLAAQIAEHLQIAQGRLSEAARLSSGQATEHIRNVQTFLAEAAKQGGGQRADLVRSALILLGEAIELSGRQGTVLVRNAQAFLNEAGIQGGGRQAGFVRNVMVALGEAMNLSEGQASVHLRNAQSSLVEAGKLSMFQLARPAPDAPVSLSDAAKFVNSLQQHASQTTSLVAHGSKLLPILSGVPGQGKAMAEFLNTTISQSGLFYESHQLQWINGNRSLAALLQEPQAQLATTAKGDRLSSPVHLQTLSLVQQQLEVLDSRQITWQGQVWPGQTMRWEIDENTRQSRGEGEDEAHPSWKTRLQLDLPRLGGVTANIALDAEGVRIDFVVAKGESATLLKQHQPALAQAFDAARLSLASVTVSQDE